MPNRFLCHKNECQFSSLHPCTQQLSCLMVWNNNWWLACLVFLSIHIHLVEHGVPIEVKMAAGFPQIYLWPQSIGQLIFWLAAQAVFLGT